MVIIDWIKKILGLGVAVSAEIQPLVADGEAVVGDLTRIIADLKAKNLTSVIADANQSLADVKVFVAEVEKVVAAMQATK